MLNESAVLLIATETPLHAGGGTSLGAVDLPIQRERHTQYPMVQASGIKGALRDLAYSARKIDAEARRKFKDERKPALDRVDRHEKPGEMAEAFFSLESAFGPETDRADAHAGALSFSDARILLFPVRSLRGVFAWVTSPFALERFARDLERAGGRVPWSVPRIQETEAWTGSKSTIRVDTDAIVLEECHFPSPTGDRCTAVDRIAEHLAEVVGVFGVGDGAHGYWRERLWGAKESGAGETNLVILSDTAFRDFVLFSTEVVSRIRVNPETGTVASGALWSEEHLPSDTVLYALVLSDAPRGVRTETAHDAAGVMKLLRGVIEEQPLSVVQLGGDETVGRGFVRMRLYEPRDGRGG